MEFVGDKAIVSEAKQYLQKRGTIVEVIAHV